jgi:hypothetical protein
MERVHQSGFTTLFAACIEGVNKTRIHNLWKEERGKAS